MQINKAEPQDSDMAIFYPYPFHPWQNVSSHLTSLITDNLNSPLTSCTVPSPTFKLATITSVLKQPSLDPDNLTKI